MVPCSFVVPLMLRLLGCCLLTVLALSQVGGMLAEYCRASGSCPAGTAQELLHLIVSSRDLTVSTGLGCGVLQVDKCPIGHEACFVRCCYTGLRFHVITCVHQVASASLQAFISILGQQLPCNSLAQPASGVCHTRSQAVAMTTM